jgi:hypothetical protein
LQVGKYYYKIIKSMLEGKNLVKGVRQEAFRTGNRKWLDGAERLDELIKQLGTEGLLPPRLQTRRDRLPIDLTKEEVATRFAMADSTQAEQLLRAIRQADKDGLTTPDIQKLTEEELVAYRGLSPRRVGLLKNAFPGHRGGRRS